jgi:hypothetical protein
MGCQRPASFTSQGALLFGFICRRRFLGAGLLDQVIPRLSRTGMERESSYEDNTGVTSEETFLRLVEFDGFRAGGVVDDDKVGSTADRVGRRSLKRLAASGYKLRRGARRRYGLNVMSCARQCHSPEAGTCSILWLSSTWGRADRHTLLTRMSPGRFVLCLPASKSQPHKGSRMPENGSPAHVRAGGSTFDCFLQGVTP